MNSLHRLQFNSSHPFSLYLAADARLSSTDYRDDQIWEVLPGSGESPALALQTRYGGRAGLASIVPMWLHDGRPIYQAQAYTKPPIITGFAPGYIRLEAALTPQLALQAEYWVMESHAVGARFTLANANTKPTTVRLDLIGFVGSSGQEQPLTVTQLTDGNQALGLGKIGNLQPMILLENANRPEPEVTQPTDGATPPPARSVTREGSKIGRDLTIEANGTLVVHYVHAALPNARESIALAQKWLQAGWDAALQQIEVAAQAIPDIETGDQDFDSAIGYAYHQLVQSFLRATASLPYGSFVGTRKPEHGFAGSGSHTDRGWSGQTPSMAYPTALAIAPIQPELAEGVIRNYLAVQQSDGWIDSRPGLGGQKQNQLAMPILARLAWGIFQYTENDAFLRDVFSGLMKFFERWFQPDMDRDGDGLPEWQDESQTGYVFTPTFAAWQGWAQGADIRCVESPDLAGYLLSEALSLKEIAFYLHDTANEQILAERISALSDQLRNLWNESQKRYVYRDRDTHLTTSGISIIHDARGNDELIPAQPLSPPNRLIVRVAGGVNLVPRMTMNLEGLGGDGKAISEQASGNDFLWAGGRGVYTSQAVFSQIDRITFEGLSRVYRVDVVSMDTTALDINAVLPLWSAGIPTEHAKALIDLLTDSKHFWHPSGISMNSAQNANYDPTNAEGSGGVWPFWVTLLGEALVELGEMEKATDLLRHLLTTQAAVLKAQKNFSEFYHADEAKGLGENGHSGGIVPLHLLLRVFGVRIISSRKVWAGGDFHWDHPVTVRQYGVTITRSKEGTHIEFPSGHQVDLDGNTWQEVIDA